MTRTYTTSEQALGQAAQIIRQYLPLIPGVRTDRTEDDENIYVEWDRAWSVGCTLSVRYPAFGPTERNEAQVVNRRQLLIEIGWSSTSRTPAEAAASAVLYAQVAQLACLIEAVLTRLNVADVQELKA